MIFENLIFDPFIGDQYDLVLWGYLLYLLPLLLLLLPFLLASDPPLLGVAPFCGKLQVELCR